MIKATNKITGNLNASIIKQYPELENITITPTLEEQKLKSEKYGFDEIIVQGIPATDLEINPSFEEQVEEGLFKEVRVGAIPQETLNIIPTEEEQTKTGIFTEVNIGAIEAVEIDPELNFDATNTIIMQGQDGTYIKKVTIDKPESLKPENIKSGETIFGVTGGLADTSDGTVTSNDVIAGKVAYANNQRVVGTIPDNGELQFAPSDEAQVIPMGLTSGGIVAAADITNLNEYDVCLTLANSLETTEDYQETTATPEDLKEGKTAYSNGERITGTMKSNNNNALLGPIKSVGNYNRGSVLSAIQKITKDFVIGNANASYLFNYCSGLVEIEVFDTSSVTNATSMFSYCSSLVEVPLLNTSKVTTMNGMFSSCGSLVTVPVLDTSKLSASNAISGMFSSCTKLSDESLNNILQMCINAVKIPTYGTRNLKDLGLTSDQVTKCQSLSNYQAFLDAGWTTGY